VGRREGTRVTVTVKDGEEISGGGVRE
jgi:hypothetical protein